MSFIAADAGLDPEKDIRWVTPDGGVDPSSCSWTRSTPMAFMPQAMGLHEHKAGQVLDDLARTEPWSETFCCLAVGRSDFVQVFLIATKRAMRAKLKATDMCANRPEKAARLLVEDGFAPNYDYAVGVLTLRYAPGARSPPSTRCVSTPNSFTSSAARGRFRRGVVAQGSDGGSSTNSSAN